MISEEQILVPGFGITIDNFKFQVERVSLWSDNKFGSHLTSRRHLFKLNYGVPNKFKILPFKQFYSHVVGRTMTFVVDAQPDRNLFLSTYRFRLQLWGYFCLIPQPGKFSRDDGTPIREQKIEYQAV